jgi:hypothetical protein
MKSMTPTMKNNPKSEHKSSTPLSLLTLTSTKSRPKNIPKTNKSSFRTLSPLQNPIANSPWMTASFFNPTPSKVKACSIWNPNTKEVNLSQMSLNHSFKSNSMTNKKHHRASKDSGNLLSDTSKDKFPTAKVTFTFLSAETKASLLHTLGN